MAQGTAMEKGTSAGRDGSQAELVRVRNLRVTFGSALAVRDVSLRVARGEAVALVGESGSGKSVTALSLLGLLPKAKAQVEASELSVGGCDVLAAGAGELRRLRGQRVGMIFQDPVSALHPMKRVGSQIGEGIRVHGSMSRREARARAIELLGEVGIPEAANRVDDYPYQFSGGQRQRIMIAMAISCKPSLLVADEPTTALDVTVQAQILELMANLRSESGMGLLFITHDLGIVARLCDRVVVMYAGRVVEDAPALDVFEGPRHPYTRGLLDSVPRIDRPEKILSAIPGSPARATDRVTGCAFRPRCGHAVGKCEELPGLEEVGDRHFAACWRAREL